MTSRWKASRPFLSLLVFHLPDLTSYCIQPGLLSSVTLQSSHRASSVPPEALSLWQTWAQAGWPPPMPRFMGKTSPGHPGHLSSPVIHQRPSLLLIYLGKSSKTEPPALRSPYVILQPIPLSRNGLASSKERQACGNKLSQLPSCYANCNLPLTGEDQRKKMLSPSAFSSRTAVKMVCFLL